MILFFSRLYNASIPIHASHEDDIKSKDAMTKRDDSKICLPTDIMVHLQSGAFLSLCKHLQMHSDEVQNIDLMGLSGFCRNCLAKVCITDILCWHYLTHSSVRDNTFTSEVARNPSSQDFYRIGK